MFVLFFGDIRHLDEGETAEKSRLSIKEVR
jgi:hypothetical protein